MLGTDMVRSRAIGQACVGHRRSGWVLRLPWTRFRERGDLSWMPLPAAQPGQQHNPQNEHRHHHQNAPRNVGRLGTGPSPRRDAAAPEDKPFTQGKPELFSPTSIRRQPRMLLLLHDAGAVGGTWIPPRIAELLSQARRMITGSPPNARKLFEADRNPGPIRARGGAGSSPSPVMRIEKHRPEPCPPLNMRSRESSLSNAFCLRISVDARAGICSLNG